MRSREEVLREFDWGGNPYDVIVRDPWAKEAIEEMADRIRELEAVQEAQENVIRCAVAQERATKQHTGCYCNVGQCRPCAEVAACVEATNAAVRHLATLTETEGTRDA